jgi:hypothetical protein
MGRETSYKAASAGLMAVLVDPRKRLRCAQGVVF